MQTLHGTRALQRRGVKRCFTFSMGVQRRSLLEFHTVCYEEENILNERPLGRIPDAGSEVKSLTPNSLLLGRCTSSILDNSQLNIQSSRSCRGLVNQVSEKLWEKRVESFVPTMIGKSKWKKEGIGTLR